MKSFAHSLRAALLAATAFVSVGASLAADGHAPAAPAVVVAKPDVAKGDAIFNATPTNGQSCASCHAADGNSSIAANPKLAQQHPEYILRQLQDFKSGKRKSAIMKPFASALSDDDMRNIAYFVGSKKVKPGFAKDKDTVALGEKIFRGGLSDRQVPACAGCHSPTGAGMPAQYPRIGGQHADYTTAQMIAFREGQRTNNPVMNGVAAKLNDREIKAVADYIAGLR
ncbi:cytochrome c [Variovorax sp. OV329]|uniref:c-type cytochrome n=1 Tax=Variovorax sp. OV329 TaxID=1882825 RepID=UPI0008E7B53E|nr:c-type cytochrome [Variovorax sp. OV329]SFM18937.1 Cytochrome c553 [Variovorax sp. OV329]